MSQRNSQRTCIRKRNNGNVIFELVEKGAYRAVLRHLAAMPGDIAISDYVSNIINGASAPRQ